MEHGLNQDHGRIKHGGADEDAVVTYQFRFARVISVLHLAERYSQSKTELVCLALT